jgi:hypothetical protein
MSNSLIQPRSIVEAFAQGNSEVASLLRKNNQMATANAIGQYSVLSAVEYTNNRLGNLLSVAGDTNRCLLTLSDDIRRLKRSSRDANKLFKELLARDSLQARMEEFIYQLEKMVAAFDETDQSALVAQYLAVAGALGVIAEDDISTQMIRGRDNKTAFDSAWSAAKRIQEKLATHPSVQEMLKEQDEAKRREEQASREMDCLLDPIHLEIEQLWDELTTGYCLVRRKWNCVCETSWAKGVWNGTGRKEMRRFVVGHGYQLNDYWSRGSGAAADKQGILDRTESESRLGERLQRCKVVLVDAITKPRVAKHAEPPPPGILDVAFSAFQQKLRGIYCLADIKVPDSHGISRFVENVNDGPGDPDMRRYAAWHGYQVRMDEYFARFADTLEEARATERREAIAGLEEIMDEFGAEIVKVILMLG